MSSENRDENSGRSVLAIGLGASVLLMGAFFGWNAWRSPDGARAAWLSSAHVVVEEFRLDDGDEMPRIAVLDSATGKRLADRNPDHARPFALVGERLWLVRSFEPYGLEAWSIPSLKTSVSTSLKAADSNLCTDGAFARVKLTDGRYGVIDLSSGAVVADRDVSCGHGDSSAASDASGAFSNEREGSSERRILKRAGTRIGGSETFLEPQYLFAGETGAVLELESDVFVVHRVELGQNPALKVSRVGPAKLEWTAQLGSPGSLERALLAPPSTLVVVGHDGIRALDAKTGTVLWRTGK